MSTLHDRAIGALVGLACGDAVGTTLEFKAPGTFAPITDMVGGGPFGLEPGQWTDDTSMALCLAESIVDVGDLDGADQLRRYLLWRDEGYLSSNGRCFDIGVTTSRQLERFRRTGDAVDPAPDEEAAANGSLMRLAPVPIRWHFDVDAAAERSGESSGTTHAARRPVDACRVLGAMTAALISGTAAEEVLAPSFWAWGELHPAVEAVARGSWRTKEPPQIRGTGYCIDALEAALWAVDRAASFEDAILRAANLGDDADTTAAIAGQLAGARWGIHGIPEAWKDKLSGLPRMVSLATALVDASGAPARRTSWAHDDELHAWWVDRDVLAGEYPGALTVSRARAKLDLLADAGVRTIVDLTTAADRLEPYDAVLDAVARSRNLAIDHLRFPIPDLGVVADDAYDTVIDVIERGRERGAVFVHCWGGVGRTATVIGCLLATEGMTHEDLIAELDGLRAGTRKARRRAPQTAVQLDLLRRRLRGTPRRRGGAAAR